MTYYSAWNTVWAKKIIVLLLRIYKGIDAVIFVAFFVFVFKFKSEENNDFLLRRIVLIYSTSWLEWKCWGHGSFSLSSSQDYSKKVKRKPLCEVEKSPFGGNRAGLEYEGTIQDVHQGNNLKLFPKHKFLCKYTQFKPDWMSQKKNF